MPELPEVETIRRDLAAFLTRKRISKIIIDDIRVLQGFAPSGKPRRAVTAEDFARRLCGQTVQKIDRRGKYLLIPDP